MRSAHTSKLPLDDDDCGMLFDDIHRGRSVRPPHGVPERPALVRWDPAAPLALGLQPAPPVALLRLRATTAYPPPGQQRCRQLRYRKLAA